jgi:hypothetical protein
MAVAVGSPYQFFSSDYFRNFFSHDRNHRCARVRIVVPPRLSRPERTGPKWMPADGTCAARKKEFQKRGVRLAQIGSSPENLRHLQRVING